MLGSNARQPGFRSLPCNSYAIRAVMWVTLAGMGPWRTYRGLGSGDLRSGVPDNSHMTLGN